MSDVVPPPLPLDPLPSSGISRLIPANNPCALISYYCGVFSLIPGLGRLIALAAIPLGVVGLRKVKREPAVHGTTHAWVGIVLGTLSIAGHATLIVWLATRR